MVVLGELDENSEAKAAVAMSPIPESKAGAPLT